MKRRNLVMGLTAAAALTAVCGGSVMAAELPAFNELNIEDYTDLEADIKILTDRTDIVDTVYAGYVDLFNETFPNIHVTYEAVSDYAEAVTLRITSGDWGDICFIPDTVEKTELSTYFAPLGDYEAMDEIYYNMNANSDGDTVYGIPNGGNTPGILINKNVWAEAGITEYPTTPEEFIDDLQLIKDNTDAIPLYTNFADGWPLGQWTGYIGIPSNADPDYAENVMPHKANPFAKPEDGMYGPYALFYMLYEPVARGLVEEDPASTDWESSKARIGSGEIATMVLQSWAINQCKDLAEDPDAIDYIPMPITVNGVQALLVNSNYCYGINNQVSEDNQLASMVYVKWLIEESPIMSDEGNIPERKDQPVPDSLANFDGLEMMTNAKEVEPGLKNEVANESEVLTDANVAKVVEGALAGTPFDDIMNEWNERWAEAQDYVGVEVTE